MGICSSKAALDVNPPTAPIRKDVTIKETIKQTSPIPLSSSSSAAAAAEVAAPLKETSSTSSSSSTEEDPLSLFFEESSIIKRLNQVLLERENLSGESTLPPLQEGAGPDDDNWRDRAQILFRMMDLNGRGALTRRDCADAIRLFLDSACYHPDVKSQGLLNGASPAEMDAAVQQVTEALWAYGSASGSISFAKFVAFLVTFMGEANVRTESMPDDDDDNEIIAP